MSSASSTAERSIEFSDEQPDLELSVLVAGSQVWKDRLPQAMEIGRQDVNSDQPDPEPFGLVNRSGGISRLVVAQSGERKVSRRHVGLTIDHGTLTVTNLSGIQPLKCNGKILSPRSERAIDWLSVIRIELHQRTLIISPSGDSASLRSLNTLTKSPGKNLLPNKFDSKDVDLDQLNAAPEFTMWLSETIEVLQSAVNSPNFLRLACQAVVDIVKLDHAQILLRENGQWTHEAFHANLTSGMHEPPTPSGTVLREVLKERKTFWMEPEVDPHESLHGISTVIASPILDSDGAVIGALYGDQRATRGKQIRDLEAKMVEVLAYAVASGLSTRKHQEQATLTRIKAARLEQFFSPELANQLLNQPELLDGREMEVSVLFCDLRDFTRTSDSIPPRTVLDWLNSVQDLLSQCVLDHNGVLVDYVGDAMLAMWGAPILEAEHATLACQAAIEMKRQLPSLDQAWHETIGQKTRVGIGISTGVALVGNTGSQRKFKYGPLGRTVNIGSRVQDATRTFNTPVLATAATIAQLTAPLASRKIGCVRMHNLQTADTIFEINPRPNDGWQELKEQYESALAMFESGDCRGARDQAQRLLQRWPDDRPTQCLRQRAEAGMHEGENFDPIWELGKCDL